MNTSSFSGVGNFEYDFGVSVPQYWLEIYHDGTEGEIVCEVTGDIFHVQPYEKFYDVMPEFTHFKITTDQPWRVITKSQYGEDDNGENQTISKAAAREVATYPIHGFGGLVTGGANMPTAERGSLLVNSDGFNGWVPLEAGFDNQILMCNGQGEIPDWTTAGELSADAILVYVDNYAALPVIGLPEYVYIDREQNRLYRWVSNVYEELGAGIGAIAEAQSVETPNDTDFIGISYGGVLAKLTWANLKLAIKNFIGTFTDSTPTLDSTSLITSGGVKAALDTKVNSVLIGANNGVAPLDSSGKVPSTNLPSYVDDVLEYASYEVLPVVGEAGKIYVTTDDNTSYRWTGSTYISISTAIGTTDGITEGNNNLYFTQSRVRDTALTGLQTGTNAPIEATDTLLVAQAKLQAQITAGTGTGAATFYETNIVAAADSEPATPTVGGGTFYVYNGGLFFKNYVGTVTQLTSYFANLDGTVSLLHFNGNLVDESGKVWTAGGTTQTSTDTPKFGSGKLVVPASSGNGITTPNHTDFYFSNGNFTIDLFIKTTTSTTYATLMSNTGAASFSAGKWTILMNNTVLSDLAVYVYEYSPTSPILISGATSIRDGNWHHVAIVREGTAWALYLDGKVIANRISSITLGTPSTPIVIGRDQYYGRVCDGDFDEVRIVKGRAVYAQGFEPAAAAYSTDEYTTSLFHFDTDLADGSAKTWTAVGNAAVTPSQNKFGAGALALDGSGDYITTSETSDFAFGTDPFTVDFWIKLNSNFTAQIFQGSTNGSFMLAFPNATQIGFGRHNVGWDGYLTHGMSTGVWYHIEFGRIGTRALLFINGIKLAEYAVGSNSYSVLGTTYLGGLISHSSANAYIDEFRVSKGICRHTGNFTPPTQEHTIEFPADPNPMPEQSSSSGVSLGMVIALGG